MQFFILGDDNEVELNKEWLLSNPVFAKLVTRSQRQPGDIQGREKKRAKRDFKLLQMMWNPNSEFSEFLDEEERLKMILELLEYDQGKFEEDEELQLAYALYEKMVKSLPSYKLVTACDTAFSNMVEFIDSINFKEVDKQGRLKFMPKDFFGALKEVKQSREELTKLKAQLIEEYQTQLTPRGSTQLGGRELKGRKGWKESDGDNNF